MRAISIALMLIVGTTSLSDRAFAIDPSYVVTLNNPTMNQVVSVGSTINIHGNVNWPFYKPDIDRVEIVIWTTGGTIYSSSSNVITTSYSSSCDYASGSSLVGYFNTTGTFLVEVNAIRNVGGVDTVMNTISVWIFVQ